MEILLLPIRQLYFRHQTNHDVASLNFLMDAKAARYYPAAGFFVVRQITAIVQRSKL
jgi:hypothetical protein